MKTRMMQTRKTDGITIAETANKEGFPEELASKASSLLLMWFLV